MGALALHPPLTPARAAAFGAAQGPILVYFHGSPGAAVEAARFDAAALAAGVRLLALDRSDIPASLEGEAYFAALAERVDALAKAGPVTLAGFSIGGAVALRVLPHLRRPVAALHLIAPALPTETYADMAGAAVFEAARRPASLRRLIAVQALVARLAPGLMVRLLFATARGQDGVLARDPAFRGWLAGVLRVGLGPGRPALARDLAAYVGPWTASAAGAPVTLWLGEVDTWAPPRLADGLIASRPDLKVERLADAGHYSTLFAALPRILAELGG